MDFAVQKQMAQPDNLMLTEMVELLQKHGVLLLQIFAIAMYVFHFLLLTFQGRLTLHGCAASNMIETARSLLQLGADINHLSRCLFKIVRKHLPLYDAAHKV
jgi:hypothetical protein